MVDVKGNGAPMYLPSEGAMYYPPSEGALAQSSTDQPTLQSLSHLRLNEECRWGVGGMCQDTSSEKKVGAGARANVATPRDSRVYQECPWV